MSVYETKLPLSLMEQFRKALGATADDVIMVSIAPRLTEQPEDALSNRGRIGVNATLERPQNDSEIARHAARMCVCGHIRADHEQVEGGVGCRHIDCACGPGCIHEGFVDAEEGANYQDHPKQALRVPRVERLSKTAPDADIFYVYLAEPYEGCAVTTKRITVNVDYDAAGKVIGIEYGV